MQPQAQVEHLNGLREDPLANGSRKIDVPDYDLIQPIGSGAYGEVWLARSTTGVLRAVKVVWRNRFSDDRPFWREFDGIKRFEEFSRLHPSQLALFHVGRHKEPGCFYYIMELADHSPGSAGGGDPSYLPHTLRADLAGSRIPARRLLALAVALTEGLSHLHARGLVHRDIKPSNIIFVNGRPKLADIGLVSQASDEQSIVGTEGYIAPEGPGTPQADIFALGKVFYEALTGDDRRRFPALPPAIRDWPDSPLAFELNAIVVKACASNLAERYKTAEALLADLKHLQAGKSVKWQRVWKDRLRIARNAAISALIVVGLFYLKVSSRNNVEAELRSENPEVNALVDMGERTLLGETPERIERAREYFKKAIQLDPEFMPAYFGLQEVQMHFFEYEAVRETAAAVKRLAPDSVEAHLGAEFVLWNEWHFREALEAAKKTLKLRAYSKRAQGRKHLAYGFLLLQSGFPEAALEQYRMAEKILPADTTIKHHLGHPYFVKRDFVTALQYYQRSLDLEPHHWLGHQWKALTYVEMGDFENALDEFREFWLGRGDDPAKVARLHDALLEAYQKGGARGYWQKKLELEQSEENPNLYFIAIFYARLGDADRAYEYLEKACEKKAFKQGLLFDLCWDHADPRFLAIGRRIGILR